MAVCDITSDMRLSGLLGALMLLSEALLMGAPVHLLCNHLVNPLGLDSARPRLSWQSDNTEQNWRQSAYRILVASDEKVLRQGTGDVWDSGKVKSSQSVGVAYSGPALTSRTRYFWTVQVWDASDQPSAFAGPAWWEMGLLSASDWQAKWLTRINPEETPDRAAMNWLALPQGAQDLPAKTSGVFRKTFPLASLPQSAALFVIARGDFVATVNGHPVSSKADWGDFDRKDVTSELVRGENTIELRLTSHEASAFGPKMQFHPTVVAALLKMRDASGAVSRVGTDETWGRVAGNLDKEELNVPGPLPQPAALFRQEFQADGKIRSARLYVTALGSYRAEVNGQPLEGAMLTPGFTDYRKRLEYQSYDITPMLRKGRNAIGLTLGDGWYSSPLTWEGSHLYTPPNRVMAQLEIHYSNGKSSVISTDGDWRTAASAIEYSQIYAGEDYDARDEKTGWATVKYRDADWVKATVGEAPSAVLIGLMTEPVHLNSELKPVSVKAAGQGRFIFDFGQNMVGWAQLKVNGATGTRVRMRFAEILSPDGSVYRENLRNADATDTYTLKGAGEETYSPTFTFHGFRYVEMTGYPGVPTLESLTGKVAGSLEEPFSGKLETSSELVNRMWKIGLWGQRGNFFSIPTDCPQRDERLGWMGDAGVFWRTGSYNFDISAFTRKFMLDVNDAQNGKGDFSNVSPDLLHADTDGGAGAPGWSDAGVIIPYTAWLQYGDTSYIDDNWDAMQRFMRYIATDNPDFIRKNGNGPNFADWLAPDPRSPQELVATAYWALSARMMLEMAKASGREQEAAVYSALLSNIRAAYQKAFIKDNGEVSGGTQTAYLLTLYAKLAPEEREAGMMDHLVADIAAHGGHLTTGFLGTPFLLFTLSEHGRADVAYQLLLNETYPSWGYMLSKGATTWWERWNGDSGDPAMNSFNHYAFGSVMAWVYRSVAGIDTAVDGAGFQHIVIHPMMDARMPKAHGEYNSAYGKVVTDWTNDNGQVRLKVQIPANARATVFIGTEKKEVGSGTYEFKTGTDLQKTIVERMKGLRAVPDQERGAVTRQIALDIRNLPSDAEKVSLANALANLSTEGDFGQTTLQEVATTLAEALREKPPQTEEAYDELAHLVRYEHVQVSADSPQLKTAIAKLEKEDTDREAANFKLADLNGKTWTLKSLNGHVVLVNFWATWCPPCRKEMPDLDALYQRFRGQGLVVLAITDEDAGKVNAFLDKHPVSYPVLLDLGRHINELFHVEGIPKSFIYNAQGHLAAEAIDMRTRSQFLALLKQAGLAVGSE